MAAEILTGNWDSALEEMQKLREAIDQKVKCIVFRDDTKN
jgi:hypothetical protein